jgi:hypothetical protein
MEFLQNINGGTALLAVAGLCVLCIVLPILFSGLSIIGTIIGTFADIVGALFGILNGGPASWCGCLAAIGGCGFLVLIIAVVASGLSSCSTNPTNFCALFGR